MCLANFLANLLRYNESTQFSWLNIICYPMGYSIKKPGGFEDIIFFKKPWNFLFFYFTPGNSRQNKAPWKFHIIFLTLGNLWHFVFIYLLEIPHAISLIPLKIPYPPQPSPLCLFFFWNIPIFKRVLSFCQKVRYNELPICQWYISFT